MFASRKFSSQSNNIWPGYVDVLASVLMVIIFVLMTFMASQFFLSDALNNKNETVIELNKKISELSTSLKSEELSRKKSEKKIFNLNLSIDNFKKELKELNIIVENKDMDINKKENSIMNLTKNINLLDKKISELNTNLEEEKIRDDKQNIKINKLTEELNNISLKIQEEKKSYESQINEISLKNEKLKKDLQKTQSGIMGYRSAFFTKLINAVGNRNDVRIVGDRFVFQSEVLFSIGSDKLGTEGKKKLNSLSNALKEITKNMPNKFQWILRIDGHTDKIPIKNSLNKFKNNWHLSTSRAVAVVEYLVKTGISPKNLAATGFGQYQPISKNNKDQSKNRRIEFKLDSR